MTPFLRAGFKSILFGAYGALDRERLNGCRTHKSIHSCQVHQGTNSATYFLVEIASLLGSSQ